MTTLAAIIKQSVLGRLRRRCALSLVIVGLVGILAACGRQAESGAKGGPFRSTDPEARGLVFSSGKAAPGYILYSPLLSDTTYLVDMDGYVVQTWKSEHSPGGGLYLLDNGHLLRSARDPEITSFRAGGVGGLIEEFDWDGERIWNRISSTSTPSPTIGGSTRSLSAFPPSGRFGSSITAPLRPRRLAHPVAVQAMVETCSTAGATRPSTAGERLRTSRSSTNTTFVGSPTPGMAEGA